MLRNKAWVSFVLVPRSPKGGISVIRRRVKRGARAKLAGFHGVFVGVMSIGEC